MECAASLRGSYGRLCLEDWDWSHALATSQSYSRDCVDAFVAANGASRLAAYHISFGCTRHSTLPLRTVVVAPAAGPAPLGNAASNKKKKLKKKLGKLAPKGKGTA